MFNSRAEYEVPVISGGIIRAVLRFPTDQQWADRQRAIRSVQRDGKEEVLGETEASSKLFDALHVSGGEAWEPEEKSAAIDHLEKCTVVSSNLDGSTVTIVLAVPGAQVTHVLNIPKMSAMRKYGQTLYQTDFKREGRSSVANTRRLLEPGAELWSACLVAVAGYADGSAVPIVHKDVAAYELVQVVSEMAKDLRPEEVAPAGQTSRG